MKLTDTILCLHAGKVTLSSQDFMTWMLHFHGNLDISSYHWREKDMNSQARLRPFTITLIRVSVLQNVHKTRGNSHSKSLSFFNLIHLSKHQPWQMAHLWQWGHSEPSKCPSNCIPYQDDLMLNLLTGRSSRTKKANRRQAAANLPDNNVWLMLNHSAHKHIKGEILKEFHLEL